MGILLGELRLISILQYILVFLFSCRDVFMLFSWKPVTECYFIDRVRC